MHKFVRTVARMSGVMGIALLLLSSAHAAENLQTGGPYVPTPQVVVDQMLRMGRVAENDFVVDLGSGDGVIVLSAAQQYRARGMGIEIDPDLVKYSNETAQRLGVADRVRFVQQDIFKTDLSEASVVTLYLLPAMMLNLRAKIFSELKPGTRVVSHDYSFGNWAPDEAYTFDVPEKAKINGQPKATVYVWYIPAKIAGLWEIKVTGGATYELALKQRYQTVDGTVMTAGQTAKPQALQLNGNNVSFVLPEAKGVARFSGQVKNEVMEGMVEVPGAQAPVRWTATRTATQPVTTD